MINNVRSIIMVIILSTLIHSQVQAVVPYLNFRSVSVNAARELVGWQTLINKAGMNRCYGSVTMTPEYIRSFKACDIANTLFGESLLNQHHNSQCMAFKVQGSKVVNRNEKAWLADYFYLPPDFESTINIWPKIDTFLIDFNVYVGFDTWVPGLFFRVHAPFASTRWDLSFCESNITAGNYGYDPGYFNDTYTNSTATNSIIGIPNSDLLSSFEQFIFAQESIAGSTTINYEPLRNARMSTFRLTKSRLAEIQMAFGYNCLLDPKYHVGLELRGSIPTGNAPTGEFLFEPIVGNGHHAELGFGMTSHWECWSDCDNKQQLNLYLDANVSHLFSAHQRRTFDLKGKPLSRYMLAVRMQQPVENLTALIDGNQIVPTSQFKNRFTTVANLTTIPVDVTIAIQADIALKLAYIRENLQWDIGYDFWTRSCEQIRRRSNSCCLNKLDEDWALKGDSFVCGFPQNLDTSIVNNGVQLAASQSKATIFNGTNNWPNGIDSTAWNQNPGIDTPKGLAYDQYTTPRQLVTHPWTYSTTWDPVYASAHPITIKLEDLDICGAPTKGLSHKFFTHFNYILHTCPTWVPYLGIGGEVEFGKNSCESCRYCSLTQWGIWIKGGLTFNGYHH